MEIKSQFNGFSLQSSLGKQSDKTIKQQGVTLLYCQGRLLR